MWGEIHGLEVALRGPPDRRAGGKLENAEPVLAGAFLVAGIAPQQAALQQRAGRIRVAGESGVGIGQRPFAIAKTPPGRRAVGIGVGTAGSEADDGIEVAGGIAVAPWRGSRLTAFVTSPPMAARSVTPDTSCP